MQTVLSKPQVYKLTESNQVALTYGKVLFIDLKDSMGERIVKEVADAKVTEEDLLQAEGVISLDNVQSLISDEDSDELTLFYVQSAGQAPVKTKITFYSKSIKNEFIESIQTAGGQNFSIESKQNTLWASIIGPLKGLGYILIPGGGLSFLAYYMENADQYSFRVPAVLYPVVVAMEYVGFIPVVSVVALILLFPIIRLIRNLIKPTKRLTLTRSNHYSSNKELGA